MKHIQIRDKFLERYKSTQNFPLIQEAESGPLGNDINWGDSLLGRLLASVFRAIESGINMKRIDSLLVQLDRAIKNKIIEELSENEEFKKGVDQIQGIAAKGGIAKTAQENPEDLKEYLEGLKEAKGDEWLIEILSSFSEEFKAILDELMAREGEEGEKTGEVVADYEVMKENLKFLAGMLSTFNTIKVPQQNTSTEKPAEQNRPVEKEVPAKTSAPTNAEHSNKPALIENYLRLLEEYDALPPGDQPKALGPGGKAEITPAKTGVKIIPGAKKVEPKKKFGEDAEDVDFEEVPNNQPAHSGTASTGTEIGKGETKLIEAYQKIKAAFIELTTKKYKNLPITSDMINGILKDADNPDSKKEVIMLYKTIVGMLKSGSLKLDPLIKESTALLPTQIQIASEKIARYGARCLQFEGLNFYAALGEFGKNMAGFNSTMKKLMTSTTFEATKKPEEGKVEGEGKEKVQGGADNKVVNYGGFDDKEAKKESKINEGVSFLSKFFGVKVGDEAVNKIKVTGSGNTLNFYMDGKKVDAQQASGYTEAKGQINGIIQDLEGKFGEQAKKTVEKNAIDLIEVIRIFNNANRIMVRGSVPSVRTGGKIDVRRANMWEMLDGSVVDINNPKGPVRNIKLFHRWNDGVLKIIKENADILRTAEVIIDAKGKTVKPKYPISKFISDSLNDNKLFQSYGSRGEKGYQSQYLESFLGISKAEAEDITHYTNDNKTTTETEPETKQAGNRKFSIIKTTTVAEMTNHLYKVDISAGKLGKDDIKFIYLVGIKDGKNSTLFKASASDFFFQGYVDGYKPKGKPSIIYLLSIKNDGKPLEEYKTIKGSAYSVGDAVNKKFTPINFEFKIKSIENLSDGDQPIERNTIEKDPKKYQDSGIKPDDVLNGIGKNYSTVHESIFQNIPVHHTPRVFKKYSEISKKRK